MANNISRDQRLDRARVLLREAGQDGAEIVESTPKLGGLRRRDVQALVDSGEAEWIVRGYTARLRE